MKNDEIFKQFEAIKYQLAQLQRDAHTIQQQLTSLQSQLTVIEGVIKRVSPTSLMGLHYIGLMVFITLAPLHWAVRGWQQRKQIPLVGWAGLYCLLFVWIILKNHLSTAFRGN